MEYLALPPVVAFVGFARSGKDTGALYLEKYGYKKKAEADKLRELALYLNPIIERKDENGQVIDRKAYKCWIEELGYEEAKTKISGIREFLVKLGHGARQVLDPDIWLNQVLPPDICFTELSQKITISDCRYKNTIDRVHECGGIAIEVRRKGKEAANDTERASISGLKADYVITNDGSIEAYYRELDKIMETCVSTKC